MLYVEIPTLETAMYSRLMGMFPHWLDTFIEVYSYDVGYVIEFLEILYATGHYLTKGKTPVKLDKYEALEFLFWVDYSTFGYTPVAIHIPWTPHHMMFLERLHWGSGSSLSLWTYSRNSMMMAELIRRYKWY